MQLATISPEATAALNKLIDAATQPTTSSPVVPAALVHIVDAENNVLFSHGSSPDTSPSSSSIAIIQSLSKIIGAMAYQQLVERGLATLDDPSTITTFLPELATKKVLTGYTTDPSTGQKRWRFEERNEPITARMLLNHTYGGGHTYFNKLLLDYIHDQGEAVWAKTNEATDPYGILLLSPLLWQPGTHTNYGQGLDWIAVLIERISGRSLQNYLQENIFSPLGLSEIGVEAEFGGTVTTLPLNAGKFWPRKMRTGEEFVTLDAAAPDVVQRADAFPHGSYHQGGLGTGLVSSIGNYTHLLSILLPQNAGVDPVSGYRVLSSESVREITSPQLPAHLRNDSRSLPVSEALPILLPVDLSAPWLDPEGSYGLGCGVQGANRVLQSGEKGRVEGSVYWYGATNCETWVDGKSGIVVAVWGNYYPWNEKTWMDFVAEVEGIVYEALRVEE